jgi:hypothetical protein
MTNLLILCLSPSTTDAEHVDKHYVLKKDILLMVKHFLCLMVWDTDLHDSIPLGMEYI